MIMRKLPDPLDLVLARLASLLDARQRDLVRPLFIGMLFAHGRRTVTAWFRAAAITDDFRRGYHLLHCIGQSSWTLASLLFGDLQRHIDPGPRWLFALDDTPTQRYGPCVEGAGRHHNPTPGPCDHKFLYGHVWVTLAWMVHHPCYDTLGLPLLASLYIRQVDLQRFPPDKQRPAFQTKLQQAGAQLRWLKKRLPGTDKPVWVVVDGFYSKEPVLRVAQEEDIVLVGRLRKDAALFSLPPIVPPGQRGPGRPRVYGTERLSLGKRAGHQQGWQTVACRQYQKQVTKTVKTFLATWEPARGPIRVVLVQEEDGWRAYFCTDLEASIASILEAVADRTGIEQVFCDVKEVEGAGQQQLRDWPANVGAFHWNLWSYSLVELWAWSQPTEVICDRSQSPWDQEPRRPSHRDKRKGLQLQVLRWEFCPGCSGEEVEEKMDQWWQTMVSLLG